MFEIGNSLREARLRQGLEFPALEQATKVRGKYLRALEDEQFDVLPAQTYVKGFLRAYAESLGLDGQLYVDEYNSRFLTVEEEPPFRTRRSPSAIRRDRSRRRVESGAVLVGLAGILVVFLIVLAAWKFTGDSSTNTSVANLGSQSPPATQRAVAPRQSVPSAIVLRASGASVVVTVRRGSERGAPVFDGTIEPGAPKRFLAPRLWIGVATPERLQIRVGGRVAPFASGHSPRVLVVTRSGVISSRAA